jgi:hypothetical protein
MRSDTKRFLLLSDICRRKLNSHSQWHQPLTGWDQHWYVRNFNPLRVLSSGMCVCSLIDVHQHFTGIYCLHLQAKIVSQIRSCSCLLLVPSIAYSLIQKMQALHSSEISVNLSQIIWRHIFTVSAVRTSIQPT